VFSLSRFILIIIQRNHKKANTTNQPPNQESLMGFHY